MGLFLIELLSAVEVMPTGSEPRFGVLSWCRFDGAQNDSDRTLSQARPVRYGLGAASHPRHFRRRSLVARVIASLYSRSALSKAAVGVRAAMCAGMAATTFASTRAPTPTSATPTTGTVGSAIA